MSASLARQCGADNFRRRVGHARRVFPRFSSSLQYVLINSGSLARAVRLRLQYLLRKIRLAGRRRTIPFNFEVLVWRSRYRQLFDGSEFAVDRRPKRIIRRTKSSAPTRKRLRGEKKSRWDCAVFPCPLAAERDRGTLVTSRRRNRERTPDDRDGEGARRADGHLQLAGMRRSREVRHRPPVLG